MNEQIKQAAKECAAKILRLKYVGSDEFLIKRFPDEYEILYTHFLTGATYSSTNQDEEMIKFAMFLKDYVFKPKWYDYKSVPHEDVWVSIETFTNYFTIAELLEIYKKENYEKINRSSIPKNTGRTTNANDS